MNKVVITGASGFLGSNLIKKLENNEDVMVYALSSKGIQSEASNIKALHKDVIDSDEAAEVMNGAIIVNCAFPRNSTGTGMADGLAYINRLFMACKRHKAKAIINISSQSVYSQRRELPADENTEICLESPYAVGKYATELMLESTCVGTDINYTNLRMASLIGPGFDQRIVNRLVKKALALEPITVSVSNQRFGFLDISDAVDAIVSLIKINCDNWKNTYTVGNGQSVLLTDIIENINDVFIEKQLEMPSVGFVDEDKAGSTSVSYELLQNDTGYKPKFNLNMSIESILDRLRRNI